MKLNLKFALLFFFDNNISKNLTESPTEISFDEFIISEAEEFFATATIFNVANILFSFITSTVSSTEIESALPKVKYITDEETKVIVPFFQQLRKIAKMTSQK